MASTTGSKHAKLYLMRHGDAVDVAGEPASSIEPDEVRFLSPKGREQATTVGKALNGLITPKRVVASPSVRCVQTAEIVASAIHFDGAVEADARLHHGAGEHDWHELLRDFGGDDVLVVGHDSWLPSLLADLAGSKKPLPFAKAQVYALDAGEPNWTIKPGDTEPRAWVK